MTAAVVFPGQGSQRTGMGADLHDRYAVARDTYAEAAEATGVDVAAICFRPDDRLTRTEFTQPCLLTTQVAMFRVAVAEFGFAPRFFGGHSLGEYTALVAAGVLPFADAVRLVRARGALMQRAVPPGQGAMAALVLGGIGRTDAARVAVEAGAEVANDNSADQLVISGTARAVARARERLAEVLPDLTFVPLRVSAPFHSSLMRPVEAAFRAEVDGFAARLRPAASVAVTSNHTGAFHEPAGLVDALVRQIAGRVRWVENMRVLAAAADDIYEIGPAAPLSAFFRTLDVDVVAVTTADHLSTRLPAARPHRAATTTPAPSPAVDPAALGDPSFRRDHGVGFAYVAGGMGDGVSGPELVIALGRAGVLGFLGTWGLPDDRVVADVTRVRAALPAGAPWGVNVRHGTTRPERDGELLELLGSCGVDRIEASHFAEPTPALVHYRLRGLRPDGAGVRVPHRLLVKVSRPDVAARFLAPAPAGIVAALRDRGLLTDAEAVLAARVPMADDICVQADASGGTTLAVDSLLPIVLRMRDRAGDGPRVRIGAAGGIGTGAAAAAAFVLGADFVLTGSVNQCTVEAATSDAVKDLLAAADVTDFGTAPDEDTFELGGRIPVLRHGVFHPARADHLFEVFLRVKGVDDLEPADRELIGTRYLRRPFADVPGDADATDPRARLATVFRWYLRDSARRARDGAVDDRGNFRVHSGPALGAFNAAVRGTPPADWRARRVADVAALIMTDAAATLARALDRTRGWGIEPR